MSFGMQAVLSSDNPSFKRNWSFFTEAQYCIAISTCPRECISLIKKLMQELHKHGFGKHNYTNQKVHCHVILAGAAEMASVIKH